MLDALLAKCQHMAEVLDRSTKNRSGNLKLLHIGRAARRNRRLTCIALVLLGLMSGVLGCEEIAARLSHESQRSPDSGHTPQDRSVRHQHPREPSYAFSYRHVGDYTPTPLFGGNRGGIDLERGRYRSNPQIILAEERLPMYIEVTSPDGEVTMAYVVCDAQGDMFRLLRGLEAHTWYWPEADDGPPLF